MALLRLLAGLLMLAWPCLAVGLQRPLIDYDFNGYVQGRLTAFLLHTDKLQGPLNTLPVPAAAGGEYETGGYLNRLEVSLATPLSGQDWRIMATAAITGGKGEIKSAYLSWTPAPWLNAQAGLITVPFGLENQLSSRLLPTVERSLLYGFGNFGWVSGLGFNFMDQYAYGLAFKSNFSGPWPGWKVEAQAGLVTGNGALMLPGLFPSQLTGRVSIGQQEASDPDQDQWSIGLSASRGWVSWAQHNESYLPIGIQQGGQALRTNFIPVTGLDQQGPVAVLGPELLVRFHSLSLSGEWLAKSPDGHWLQGYYGLVQWDLLPNQVVSLAGKWEDSVAFFSDGVHNPGTRYQALTVGVNWKPITAWRLQADYIVLYQDFKPHQFTGSDLFITQLQFEF